MFSFLTRSPKTHLGEEVNESLLTNLSDIISGAIEHAPERRSMIIYDRDSALAESLAAAYHEVIPNAQMIDFGRMKPKKIRALIDELNPKDLVVLVQSTSFRLNEFRFRLELFNRGLAVIEHPHLGRMPEEQIPVYVDALAYDADHYRQTGVALKEKIDKAKKVIVESRDGSELIYESSFEAAKLNVGDYREMKNTGGQFPIGEVFTEPENLEGVSGEVQLFAYGDAKFQAQFEPQKIVIKNGTITDTPDITPGFQAVLDQISADEQLLIRELGFGMNRAMTPTRFLNDIGSYERMCGIHLSIGHKHTIYAKTGLPKRSSKYHVDVFVDVARVLIDGEVVFENGAYLV